MQSAVERSSSASASSARARSRVATCRARSAERARAVGPAPRRPARGRGAWHRRPRQARARPSPARRPPPVAPTAPTRSRPARGHGGGRGERCVRRGTRTRRRSTAARRSGRDPRSSYSPSPMLAPTCLAPHAVARGAAITPDAVALEHVDGARLTYAELDRRARAWAGALAARGVAEGDHVATMLPNTFDAHITMLALAWLRVVEVPLNVAFTGRMLAYALDHADVTTRSCGRRRGFRGRGRRGRGRCSPARLHDHRCLDGTATRCRASTPGATPATPAPPGSQLPSEGSSDRSTATCTP